MRRILAKVLVAIIGIVAVIIIALIVCATWPVADKYPRNVAQTKAGPIEPKNSSCPAKGCQFRGVFGIDGG